MTHLRALVIALTAALLCAAPAGAGAPDPAALERAAQVEGAAVGVYVADAGSGELIFSGGDQPMIPASTAKLLTAAAALRALGPDWRFTTSLKAEAPPGGDGTLDGDLYVVGGGDPTLVIEKLWKLVYDLKLRGLTRVAGDVVFDDSYMDDAHSIRGWHRDRARGPSYFAPVGALSVNFNAAAVVIGPGPAAGEPARVHLETPAGDVVTVRSEATTSRRGARPSLRLSRELDGDRVLLVVGGSIPEGAAAETYYRAVADPSAYFAAVFAEVMARHGIQVDGRYRDGEAPEGAISLIDLKSPPLATILLEMNKSSSNFYAEQVFKALGAERFGAPGSADKGAEAVGEYLGGLGIPAGDYRVVNGSGLSTDWQVRPSQLGAVLVDMAGDPRVGAEFVSSLSIGGRDGTLRKRFTAEAYELRVRGKTGSLSGVSCLAGYADGGDGRRYAFAVMVNGLDGPSSPAKAAQDRLVEALLSPPEADMDDPSIRVAGGSP